MRILSLVSLSAALGLTSASAVTTLIGSFGGFYEGSDSSFDPFVSPTALLTPTDSYAGRQAWLSALPGSGTQITQNFDSGFAYGSASSLTDTQTVDGYTYSTAFYTANQTGVFRAASSDTSELDPVGSGPDSTRGFNVEEGQYNGADRGYFQVKVNSTSANDGGLKVDFGGNGVTSFGFYLTGREDTKQDVNLRIEYVNSDIEDVFTTATGTGNDGDGGLGFVGYIGNGNEIANFKLEEVYALGGKLDIFAIDGLVTVVPEPSAWGFTSALGVFLLVASRRRNRN
jgi:hypothetical protein